MRLLIVDDEVDILDYLSEILGDSGYDTITAQNGYDALAILQQRKIDMIITDIWMPDMDGYQLFIKARELFPKMPILVITGFGYDPNHVVPKIRVKEKHSIMFKPPDPAKLIDEVSKLLKQKML